jgi:NAD(P)-dependent dehydrogenase (short-subunit alcohol dehydrogenase family)
MSQPNFTTSFTKTYHRSSYPAISPSLPQLSATGKNVLITGGATGIGFSIATAFVSAGASNIILVARRDDALQKAKDELSSLNPKTSIHTYAASVSDAPRIQEVFAHAREAVGDIDILVSCAGIANSAKETLALPLSEVWQCFETNVKGALNVVHEFLVNGPDTTTKQRVIIDISSAAAHLALPKQSPYCASKAAFTSLLRQIYIENKASGLRTYSIHPGGVLTQMARSFGYSEGDADWDDVELPGHFCVWLASEEATFLAGRFVWASWDVEELQAREKEFEQNPELCTLGLLSTGNLFPVATANTFSSVS